MATSKAKRLIVLAQPHRRSPNAEQILRPKSGLRISPAGSQPRQARPHARKAAQPQGRRLPLKTNGKAAAGGKPEGTSLMPVKAHVYHSIAELNSGFEQVVRQLLTLGGLNLFRSSDVKAMRGQISRMRAQANRDFALAIHDREKANVDVLRV